MTVLKINSVQSKPELQGFLSKHPVCVRARLFFGGGGIYWNRGCPTTEGSCLVFRNKKGRFSCPPLPRGGTLTRSPGQPHILKQNRSVRNPELTDCFANLGGGVYLIAVVTFTLVAPFQIYAGLAAGVGVEALINIYKSKIMLTCA